MSNLMNLILQMEQMEQQKQQAKLLQGYKQQEMEWKQQEYNDLLAASQRKEEVRNFRKDNDYFGYGIAATDQTRGGKLEDINKWLSEQNAPPEAYDYYRKLVAENSKLPAMEASGTHGSTLFNNLPANLRGYLATSNPAILQNGEFNGPELYKSLVDIQQNPQKHNPVIREMVQLLSPESYTTLGTDVNDPSRVVRAGNKDPNNIQLADAGTPAIAPTDLGRPSSEETKALSELDTLGDLLADTATLYDPSYVGAVEGRLGTIRSYFTGGNETQFRRNIASMQDSLLRAKSGAQINEQEYARLVKILPNVTDSPAQYAAKVESFTKEYESIKRNRESRMQGGRKMTGSKAPTNLKDLSDAALLGGF